MAPGAIAGTRTSDEPLSRAVRGLYALVITLTILLTVAAIWDLLGPRLIDWEPSGTADLWTPRVFTVLSLGLLFLIRHGKARATTLINLGLFYEVAICLVISYVELTRSPEPGTPPWAVSFASVFIILFPMFVPTSLPKTLIAAIVAASTGPVAALLFAHFHDLPPPSAGLLAQGYFMNYLVVWLVLRTVKQIDLMNRELSRARQMGSYELQERLGQGGMGEVWRATHRMLRRPAAVKLIRPEALGASDSKGREVVLRRFEREAQATADLHSQHTIRLYDFGTTSDGTLFYVMELLDGVNMRILIEKFGPQPASRTAYLLLQACDSLWDAHQSKLVHRDIKPANLYVCRYGHQYDFVKVLDFGLVRPSGGPRTEETQLTKAGLMTGTPAFIAPEMAREGGGDERSDIYALGCVAYWMLTGQLVFDRENPLQMALAHIQEEPIPPSQRTEIEIPSSFEKLLMACLEKDPNHRPQNIKVLADALRGDGCHAGWTPERAAAWWKAHSPSLTRSTE